MGKLLENNFFYYFLGFSIFIYPFQALCVTGSILSAGQAAYQSFSEGAHSIATAVEQTSSTANDLATAILISNLKKRIIEYNKAAQNLVDERTKLTNADLEFSIAKSKFEKTKSYKSTEQNIYNSTFNDYKKAKEKYDNSLLAYKPIFLKYIKAKENYLKAVKLLNEQKAIDTASTN